MKFSINASSHILYTIHWFKKTISIYRYVGSLADVQNKHLVIIWFLSLQYTAKYTSSQINLTVSGVNNNDSLHDIHVHLVKMRKE